MPKHLRTDSHGYVAEHILVMEKKLKRHIRKGEVVHHLNETRDDNRIKNLVLYPSNSAHSKYHSTGRFYSIRTRKLMRKARLGYRKWKGILCSSCHIKEARCKMMCEPCYK